MKKNKSFAAYIIGEESLTSQCAAVLSAEGFEILGIISSNTSIINWARQHHIKWVNAASNWQKLLLETEFDYLFSIVNSRLLPSEILQKPRHFAINYHDALLPRYAGVHATSWAIFNQEQQHGITWHVMTEVVDAGDILAQATVTVDPDETALSLNLKCYQAALESFKALVKQLFTKTYELIAQDLSQRTYFGYESKLPGNGLIDWETSAEMIERMHRALRFGDYANRLGVLKIQIGTQFYIVEGLHATDILSTREPGTLVGLEETALTIATKTNDISITQVTDFQGEKCDLQGFLKRNIIKVGDVLQYPDHEYSAIYENLSCELFKHESYWVQALKAFKPATLPFLSPTSEISKDTYLSIEQFVLSKSVLCKLQKQYPDENIKTILLTILFIYLYRIGNHERLGVGITGLSDSLILSNLFPIYLPCKLDLNDHLDFSQALAQIKNKITILQKHKSYLNDVVVRYTEIKQTYLTSMIGVVLSESNIINSKETEDQLCPIKVTIDNQGLTIDCLQSQLNEDLKRFLKNSIGHLKILLTGVINKPDTPISYLLLLTKKEQHQLLVKWNQTQRDYPRDKTVYQLFEEQVAKTPNKVAVVFEEQQLTYQELNEKSNQLAHYLQAEGLKAGQYVALCVQRNLEMVIGLLGIIKAGGVYVPIDPEYPEERIKYMVEDTAAELMLTQSLFHERCEDFLSKDKKIILLDNDYANKPKNNFVTPESASNDSLYVMYTSGSTGQPKGVVVSHRNVVNLISNFNYINFKQTDNVGQTSNITFDTATLEIWGSLLHGAKLVIISKKTLLFISKLFTTIQMHQISILWLTSALFNELVKQNSKLFNRIDKLFIGGEKLNTKIAQEFIKDKKNKPGIFLNAYGPTETTAFSVSYRITDKIFEKPSIPIGKPINNTQCYVVDKNLQPVPAGVIAELLIGGEGVSKGYLNQPEKTQERFIRNPFFEDDTLSNQVYCTGDLVRWLFNGNLDYVGRNDDQVKIRGFRIEVGEVEYYLNKHPQLSQAIVCVHAIDETKQLVVYFVSKKNQHKKIISIQSLKRYLAEKIPSYMVPTNFFEVDRFPLTPNGKIDRKVLMENRQNVQPVRSIKPATSLAEILLIEIFKKTLCLDQIGIDENFFALGGDSIIAMQVVAKANQAGFFISVPDIFKYPTIESLAKWITQKKSVQNFQNQDPITFDVYFPLAPIQQWLFRQELKHPEQFSQVCLLTLFFLPNVDRLQNSLKYLVQKHPAFRLCFAYEDHVWQQCYRSELNGDQFLLEVINVSEQPEKDLEDLIEQWSCRLQENFSFQNVSLIKAVLFINQKEHISKLLIVVHHLITDGVSWRILLNDLTTFYQVPSKTVDVSMGTSYQTWIKALYDYQQSEAFEVSRVFWQTQLNQKNHPLPRDYAEVKSNFEGDTKTVETVFSAEETMQWLQLLPQKLSIKAHHILITLVIRALSAWLKTDEVTLDLESHGREEGFGNLSLSETVGWFTSLFTGHFKCHQNLSLIAQIKSIQQQLNAIPHHGIGYGLLHHINKTTNACLSEVVFNYWGQLDQMVDAKGFHFDHLKMISHPDNVRSHLLSIEAVVKFGQLHILWHYNPHFHAEKTIKTIARQYQVDLRELIKSYAVLDQIYPLLPLQKGLLFHGLYTVGSEAYMTQVVWRNPHSMRLDLDSLKKAFESLMARHELLRACFIWEGLHEPIQSIKATVDLPWYVYDWTGMGNVTLADEELELDVEKRLSAFLKADREVSFQFDQAPLMRVTIIKLPEQQYWVVLTVHHILLDGWSLSILLEELDICYQARLQNKKANLPETLSCLPYFSWLEKIDYTKAKAFWAGYLCDYSGVSMDWGLSSLFIKKKEDFIEQNTGLVEIVFEDIVFSEDFSQKLKKFCQRKNITISTLFQGLWALLLHRYSQSEAVVFGMTFAGRLPEVSGIERQVGLFINTLPLRIDFLKTLSVSECLANIQMNASKLVAYQNISLANIQSWTNLTKGASLFNTLLVFESYPINNTEQRLFKFADIKIIDYTHYPLSCIVIPNEQLTVRLAFDQKRIDPLGIKQLANHCQVLLMQMIEQSDQNIQQLEMLTPQEKQQILMDWSQTEIDYSKDKTVGAMLRNVQARKTPHILSKKIIEEKLIHIWSDVLKVSIIETKDNFFDLGGNSLQALELLGQLKLKFHIEVSIRALFEYPTILALAAMIESLQNTQQVLKTSLAQENKKTCLVALKQTGHKSPLFLIHPVGGTVFWYTSLVKYFDDDRPLYAIQDPGIEADNIPFDTLEEMASFYKNLICDIQPHGPYLIGGASAGANISVETARQLRVEGESVSFVGLLDGWVPYPDTLMHQEFFEANMRRQYRYMQDMFVRKGIFQAESLLHLQWHRLKMYSKYRIPIVDFKLTLFKAAQTISIYQSIEDDFNHWENYSTQAIEKYTVPGDHETMFQEPYVANLAIILNQKLSSVEDELP